MAIKVGSSPVQRLRSCRRSLFLTSRINVESTGEHSSNTRYSLQQRNQRLPFSTLSRSDLFHKHVNKLLTSTPGYWTARDWHQALEDVRYWKTQSIDEAWKLMDRIVQEESVRKIDNSSFGNKLDSAFLNSELVYSWSQNPEKLTARNILSKLDAYRSLAPDLYPDIQTYSMILNTAIKRGEDGVEELAEELLQKLASPSNDNPFSRPDRLFFNIMIDMLAKSHAMDAPQRAEALLKRMKGLVDENPDQITYNSVMSVWSQSGHEDAVIRVEELLKESPNPDRVTFLVVLTTLAKSKDANKGERAEAILQTMVNLHQEGNVSVKPDIRVFNAVLHCWSKTSSPHAAKRAEEILRLMHLRYKAGKRDCKPNNVSYGTVIGAWANSDADEGPERAEALLLEMEHLAQGGAFDTMPNEIVMSTVMSAWARSGRKDSVERSAAIIQKMDRLTDLGVEGTESNIFSYNILLDACVKTNNAEKAEEILNLLINGYIAGSSDIKPDELTFNTVITAWSRSRSNNAPQRAEAVLRKMKELSVTLNVHPDEYTYTSLITTWARSGSDNSTTNAEFYLNEMRESFKCGDVALLPKTIVFNAVIHAWSKSRQPYAIKMTRALVDEMNTLHKAGFQECAPNVITYTTIIHCIARSGTKDKASLAWDILEDMEQQGIEPNIDILSSILQTCAMSRYFDGKTREKAFQIASRAFYRICRDFKPTFQCFSFFFQAAIGLDKEKEVEMVYNQSSRFGLQDELLKDLQAAAPKLASRL